MKVNDDDYRNIESALMTCLRAHNLHPFMVSTPRHMWDVFSKAASEGRINVNDLYRRYEDAHLETAMRKMFKRGK